MLGLDGSTRDTGLDQLAREGAEPELRMELARLDDLLRDLPSGQRTAWILRRVDGHSLEDVATACACSLATAKRRIRAADQKVRRHMTFQGGDDA